MFFFFEEKTTHVMISTHNLDCIMVPTHFSNCLYIFKDKIRRFVPKLACADCYAVYSVNSAIENNKKSESHWIPQFAKYGQIRRWSQTNFDHTNFTHFAFALHAKLWAFNSKFTTPNLQFTTVYKICIQGKLDRIEY